MANVVSTDVLEEDAADLQFPKDEINIESDFSTAQYSCVICKKEIKEEPVVRCAECVEGVGHGMVVCVQCFALGLSTRGHHPHHSYRLDRRHAPFFPSSDWPIETELELLSAVLECGYGNWVDIAKRIVGRAAEEVRQHFDEYYLDNRDHVPEFPIFRLRAPLSEHPPFKYNPTAASEEPPRFPLGTFQHRYFAGYNAARGDFEQEYDNAAEAAVAAISEDDLDLDDPEDCADQEVVEDLQVALVRQYNERLRARAARKRVIKNHGLLLLRKFPILLSKYDASITRPSIERLFPFLQLMAGGTFDYLLESLDREMEVQHYYRRLREYREAGLTHFYSCHLYEEQKSRRNEMLRNVTQIRQNPFQFLKKLDLDIAPVLNKEGFIPRKTAPPLNIVLLPGYERLTPEERELCTTARMVPESYLAYKELLVNESCRNGGIRLATARQLIKIDVNKTRKLFNFLRDTTLIKQL